MAQRLDSSKNYLQIGIYKNLPPLLLVTLLRGSRLAKLSDKALYERLPLGNWKCFVRIAQGGRAIV